VQAACVVVAVDEGKEMVTHSGVFGGVRMEGKGPHIESRFVIIGISVRWPMCCPASRFSALKKDSTCQRLP
jgi:hypothetical protein